MIADVLQILGAALIVLAIALLAGIPWGLVGLGIACIVFGLTVEL